MTKIGYMRVSTQDQCPDRQANGLRGRCDRLHLEVLSAVSPHRPVYEAVLGELRRGDTLVVWDLDRAFRSVLDAASQADRLRSMGVEFEIVSLQVDTATPAGMLVYTIMSAIAEFERRLLSQRTREGMTAARLRGARIGRPPKLDADRLLEARHLIEECGAAPAAVAHDLGVARWTLMRALHRECDREGRRSAAFPTSHHHEV